MRIAIIGGGGHAKVVVDAILAAGRDEISAILDDNPALWGKTLLGCPILGPIDSWRDYSFDACVIGIGDNANRKRQFEKLVGAASGLRPSFTRVRPAAGTWHSATAS